MLSKEKGMQSALWIPCAQNCKSREFPLFSFGLIMALRHKASYTLSALLLLLLVALKFSASSAQASTHNFTYNGFKGANLQLNGIATILPSGLLQLTDLSNQQLGHAFYPLPLNFNASSLSFSTTFVFAVAPGVSNKSGHGLAFVISPSPKIPGALVAEYLGLFNSSSNDNSSSHIFAVEIDTVRSLEFQDANNNHVGIDINSLTSNQSAPAAYFSAREGKNISLYLASGSPIQIWIDYDGVNKHIDVVLAPAGMEKPNRPLLSSSLDLSQVFLDYMYVGFSASTGVLEGSHYILGWSFSKNGQAQSLDLSRLPSVPRIRRPRSSWRRNLGLAIGLSLGVATLVVLIVVAGAVYSVRRKKFEEIREDWEQEYGPHRFTYKDLYKATKGFKDKELLGSGGFGVVYRGTLPTSKTQVAIKRISHDSKQGMKQFIAEIVSLGRLRHRNLVQLLGYCRRSGELFLVYDYMPNRSLDHYLFNREAPKLNWHQRYKILQGVASVLVYLHEEWEQLVLHRDVKASNVLLDADFKGKLGDFGLARLYEHGANPQTTHVVGTLGYLAPELTKTGKATTKTDVFAFGALMLEVACGRRPVEHQELPEKMMLVDWVHECWRKGNLLEVTDPCLADDYSVEQMELVLKLGLVCSHPVDGARPSMRQVLTYLDGDAVISDISLEGFITDAASAAAAATAKIGYGFSSLGISYSTSQSHCSIGSTLSDGR